MDLWTDQPRTPVDIWYQWTSRAETLIPSGSEPVSFSASRVFAVVYPVAVRLAAIIASPTWHWLADGDADMQRQFKTEVGLLLGHPDHQPPEAGDAIAHWMKFDSSHQPSRPQTTFPDTRDDYQSTRPTTVSTQSRDRHQRSAFWFGINRRGGSVILHHRHIRPVLIRDWSPRMDGIEATIFACQTTIDLHHPAIRRHPLQR